MRISRTGHGGYQDRVWDKLSDKNVYDTADSQASGVVMVKGGDLSPSTPSLFTAATCMV